MAKLKKLKTYSWKLKTVYWKLKTYSLKVNTSKCEQKIANTHPKKYIHLPTHPWTHPTTHKPTHTQTSELDDYNKLSLWLSLKNGDYTIQ